ncbi:40S ribosomal protein S30 [Mycena indigotica]|uniref:40S ribosomal protein S30 n=1 Tax=Mycena indigotica TaxID=2126181 RepID=A0A8H6SGJ9_9AGAR|nr:40S ribosomal protein S30 [Mycena indigotica]KAF7297445.1 40S ribosomal protein S30 [Mycena indigotica]
MASPIPPPNLGIHHLKLPTASIPAKLDFYTTILGFKYRPELDHKHPGADQPYGVLVQHQATSLLVELRLNPTQATAQRGWDAITWLVETRADLEDQKTYLEAKNVDCSRVLRGVVGWVLVAEDPDGQMVRWYCKEEHEFDQNVDVDERWLPSD